MFPSPAYCVESTMKKFLSLLLAVVLVCSMATIALAADGQPNTCPYCKTFTTTDEVAYNAHISGGCNIKYRPCKYGCGAGFSAENLAAHEAVCPEGSATCDYCGKTYSPVKAYDDHLAACKESHLNIPADKVGDTIKGLDWNGIITKIVDFFASIIEKITSLFAK